MAKKQRSLKDIFFAGWIKENPVLRLVLGTCPTLAVTTQAVNGLGMGAAALLVLVGSNAVISLLRKVIPDNVRIPAFITVIAGFVTIVQMLVKAFLPSLNDSLGIFLPLIVVNCIILGRAESFASKNPVIPSIIDGIGMGIGFTITLVLFGSIRELLGNGSIFGYVINDGSVIQPMLIMILPPGGFFVFGVLMAWFNKMAEGKGEAPATLECCNCPQAAYCREAQAVPAEEGGDK
ncbi:MAG: electron transport complex subunit E [Lachnospiraceae bacterium]|nr:electron transport complex subunit E [Lachnospiraceae bacterium]